MVEVLDRTKTPRVSVDLAESELQPSHVRRTKVCVRDVSWHSRVISKLSLNEHFAMLNLLLGTCHHEHRMGEHDRGKYCRNTRMERLVQDARLVGRLGNEKERRTRGLNSPTHVKKPI